MPPLDAASAPLRYAAATTTLQPIFATFDAMPADDALRMPRYAMLLALFSIRLCACGATDADAAFRRQLRLMQRRF